LAADYGRLGNAGSGDGTLGSTGSGYGRLGSVDGGDGRLESTGRGDHGFEIMARRGNVYGKGLVPIDAGNRREVSAW